MRTIKMQHKPYPKNVGEPILSLCPSIIIFSLLSLCLMYVQKVQAQVNSLGRLHGRILNEEKEEVLGATILLRGTSLGAATDANGYYEVNNIPAGNYIVIASSLGYVTSNQEISLEKGQSLKLDLILESSMEQLDNVTIFGKSTAQEVEEQPFEVEAVDARQLHNTTLDIGHTLDRVSGVRVRESGGVGSRMNFSLNGFSGNQVKFFIDGVPMENFGSSFQLNNIPVNLAERIEIYKGVVPIWLGSDALGGAINIVTNGGQRNYLDVSYAYGSFNTHRSVVNTAYTSESGFTVRLNAFQNYSDNNYWVDVDVADINTGKYYPQQRVRRFHDTYHNETLIAKAGVVNKGYADELLVGITIGKNYNEIQTGARLVSVYGDWHRQGNIVMPGVRYRKQNLFIKGLDLTVNANYNFGQEQNIDTVNRRYNWFGDYKEYDGEGSERSRSMYKYSNNNGIATANLRYQPNESHAISLNHVYNTFNRQGSDELYPENDSYDQPRISRKNVTGLGYTYTYSERGNASVFLKHYEQANRFSNFSDAEDQYIIQENNFSSMGYGIAATYFITESLQLKGSYEKSYRLPETEELYGDVVNLRGNIDLDPETSHNYNLGLGYKPNLSKTHRISANANLLYRDAQDFIRPRLDNNQVMQIMDNLVNVTNVGVDGEIRYAYQDLLSAGANITYQNLRNNTRYEAGQVVESLVYRDRIPNKPYLFGNADVSVYLKDLGGEGKQLTIGYNLLYVHDFYLYWPSLGSDKLGVPEQLSHDLSLTYALSEGKYNITIEGRNLADAKLYDNFSLQKPGRSIVAKLRYFISK